MNILQVHNLSYELADRSLLFQQVSFSVSQGRKYALIGPNGCGKSTLLRLIAHAKSNSSACIAVGGPLWHVPQQFHPFGSWSIAQALGIAHKIQALEQILSGDLSEHAYAVLAEDWQIEEKARAALHVWGLSSLPLDRPFGQLSGGKKPGFF
ncbi:MAG: ATP-binding cassette domain-containing protein [Rikenellaceae bacterium]|nr:ATP-binding cassette domain-containing protein [Rikenellaceae bacterium]